MRITVRPHLRSSAHRLVGGSLLLGVVITAAACGASATTAAGLRGHPSRETQMREGPE